MRKIFHGAGGGVLVCGLALAMFAPAQAKGFKILYAFKGGGDGAYPDAALIADGAGNLYGTTNAGGSGNACGVNVGCGTAFMLAPNGTETVLHTFTGGSDGAYPQESMIRDEAGNLYGATEEGGIYGHGTVFKITPGGTETVLHQFTGGSDGAEPSSLVFAHKKGNLIGTAFFGGDNVGCAVGGSCGHIFKISATGTESDVYDFTAAGGANPIAAVIKDKAGNLYGTTPIGGGGNCNILYVPGCGTVYKLAPDGTETVLHSFAGGSDGIYPYAALTMDGAGNLYGTTEVGGSGGCSINDLPGCGTVFKIAPDGTETVLHAFTGGRDGGEPG